MTERNQCDGCSQGLPVKDGNHYRDGLPWIGCTAKRYTVTDPIALLRACQVASGLSIPRYATERLARSPRCVFYWLRGEKPIPPRMVAFLERSPEYPKALELMAHPATEVPKP